jgi:hypothetical protein
MAADANTIINTPDEGPNVKLESLHDFPDFAGFFRPSS